MNDNNLIKLKIIYKNIKQELNENLFLTEINFIIKSTLMILFINVIKFSFLIQKFPFRVFLSNVDPYE